MKNLILYCHPNPGSFTHALLETIIQELKASSQEFKVRDLYALNFDGIKKASDFRDIQNNKVPQDIESEQHLLLWADRLIVIYPIWWAGLPALLKGYIDRIFTYGFAYTYNFANPSEFKLAGKEVYLFTTMGAPAFFYRITGMIRAMNKTSDHGIFKFCKMKVKHHLYFGRVPSSSPEKRAKYLEKTKKVIQKMKHSA